ncbi:hypothetical protein BC939DRAFT_503177 [Gamsiella multidivaricata]|uniref:uncharacterized protein n=1 Tax=Gamsiella multidivaricata TaxID=101098 RepID=UPI00221E81E1|nr:uncharacterized protein BC939DRAFT_503177 [Gamsiella multidivaricata]KAI7823611.1 hypothetical protein BC939DRAFT_503177 [Gamsiella multidivaricata]
MSNIIISEDHPYRAYIEQQGLDNLLPISFFQFHRFTHSQKDYAGQEYNKLIALVMQQRAPDVGKAASKLDESMKDPVARYIMSVISYAHYFTFHDHVPTHINERQGFADLMWPFIRGAMTMTGVETQYLEVLIAGVLERKNLEKDGLTEAKQAGQYADGVAFWEDSQIFLSEASTIDSPRAEKLRQGEFKLARAMRDSWVSQVRATCKHSVPLSGVAVFGSSTFKDETKLWRLDFRGLAMRVKAEVDAREEDADPVDHEMRELLEKAVPAI